MSTKKVMRAGILGATGTVGQRFICLLSSNPRFEIHVLGASDRSAGRPYSQATNWKLSDRLPENVASMIVKSCNPSEFEGCDLIFSGLDASVATEIEKSFMEGNFPVFSNAKNYRMFDTVPLVIPTANPEHFAVIGQQRKEFNLNRGYIITNSNCSVTGIAVVLKALQLTFGKISKVMVTTMQAISGAGYPGVASLDIMDNVVPHIGGEEEKIEQELGKILGSASTDNTSILSDDQLKVSAMCNRVAVIDGHTSSVSIEFASGQKPSIQEIKTCLSEYRCMAQQLGCHSAPKQAIIVHENQDRPQPRLDRMNENGMAVSIGRIRECPILDFKFTILVHNTILGAAGASMLNAELASEMGLI
ncbi:putative aspartate-semialdehyde dehydrogenase [Smittium culicis]|uniref:Aspartate-semialdehyde dehydrogenase n=1 Tax=Smittium culicis TaxID=133412 RepID=A0A1R1XY67_9FUNG|nr:putative aspartate-semialdehyde dehydrogenase [Smittium culicis]